MPRIRTIKPEFWSSPGIETTSPWSRLLFIAMWNWADVAWVACGASCGAAGVVRR